MIEEIYQGESLFPTLNVDGDWMVVKNCRLTNLTPNLAFDVNQSFQKLKQLSKRCFVNKITSELQLIFLRANQFLKYTNRFVFLKFQRLVLPRNFSNS